LGEVRNGEGVYGLRRAFALAGAETLVMSLWPVSDLVTRELMTAYYTNLQRGQGRGAALRAAQLQMLKQPDRRAPYYWASFIQAGEWGNLNGQRLPSHTKNCQVLPVPHSFSPANEKLSQAAALHKNFFSAGERFSRKLLISVKVLKP
jgi:hypothetical protein